MSGTLPDARSEAQPGAGALAAAALLVALLTVVLGQHDRQLWAPDELREAGISRAMARTGDFVTPRLNGTPFLEKPPLFHAVAAAIFRATGSDARFVARLPAALFGLLALLATWLLARRLGGPRHAALSALVLATTNIFFISCHHAVTDDALPSFVTLAFLALERARASDATWRPFAGLGLALGLLFLVKGLVGPAIFVAAAGGFLLWRGEVRRFADRRLALVALVCLAPIAVWIGALHAREGGGAVDRILPESWTRATADSPDHGKPFWFYGEHLPMALLPWTPLVLLGAAAALAAGRGRLGDFIPAGRSDALRLPAAWLLGGVLLLSAASAKRAVYLLPLVPAGAILAAAVLERLLFEERPERHARPIAIGLAALACLGLAGAAVADAVVREEALVGVGGLALVAVGAVLAVRAARRREPALLAAVVFIATALAFALGLRASGEKGDRERGAESIAAALGPHASRRPILLIGASEALRGGLSYYFNRDFPEARTPEDVLRSWETADSGLVVVADKAAADTARAALGEGRILWQQRFYRREIVVFLFEPARTGG